MSNGSLSSRTSSAESGLAIQVTSLSGSPYDRGLAHGRFWAAEIHRILEVYSRAGAETWARLPNLGEVLRQVDRLFDEEGHDELHGMADGAGVAWKQLVAHDLYVFCELLGSGCSHFAVTAAGNQDGQLLQGSNLDVPVRLLDRQAFSGVVVCCSSPGKIPYLTVLIPGVLCGIGGVNSRGLGVTSAVLLDQFDPAAPVAGRRHSVTVRRLLSEAEDVDAAVEILRSQPKYGAWSVCLTHAASDRLSWVEYRDNEVRVEASRSRIFASNHALLFPARRPAPEHSVHRRNRLRELLDAQRHVGVEAARQGLRDRFDLQRGRETRFPTMNTVRRVDNLMSSLWESQTRTIWLALTGQPSPVETPADQSGQLSLDKLMPSDTSARHAADSPPPLAAGATDPPRPIISAERLRAAWETVLPSGIAAGGDVCRRLVLRLVACADAPPAPVSWAGCRVLIAGDNRVARALAARIERGGGTAVQLGLAVDPVEAVVDGVDRAWEAGPLPWLFLATARDEDGPASLAATDWDRRLRAGVLAPFLICQRWYRRLFEAGLLDQSSLVAALALGGDYGLSHRIEAIESGALTGLLKGVRDEAAELQRAHPQVKLVDAEGTMPPEELAERLLAEGAVRDGLVEVGYLAGRRYALCGVPEAGDRMPPAVVLPTGNWVVTGGARGVTAVVARALGQRFGLKLHLIGSSPLAPLDSRWQAQAATDPKALRAEVMRQAKQRGEVPVQAWGRVEKSLEIDRNLKLLEGAGVRYEYHACDVSDRQVLATTLDAIRAADGPVHGILHGAGVENACKFERKTADHVRRTFQVKVGGAAALLELTRDDPLRHVVAFGSISGRWGGVGQTDYCAANDMLAKLLAWQQARRPECRHLCFHWPAWDEVGMAARPESRLMLERAGLRFMPPNEGASYVVRELSVQAAETEIVIDDPDHSRKCCEAVVAAGDESQAAGRPPGRSPRSGRDAGDPISVLESHRQP